MIAEMIIFIISDILCMIMLIANLVVFWKINKLLKKVAGEESKDE